METTKDQQLSLADHHAVSTPGSRRAGRTEVRQDGFGKIDNDELFLIMKAPKRTKARITVRFPYVALAIRSDANEMYMQRK